MAKRLKRHTAKGSKLIPIIALAIVIAAITGFIWAQTGLVLVRDITYSSINIPRQYSGYKIAHITNIDNERQHLASKLKGEDIDIIIVSGGLVDEKGKYDKTVKELNDLAEITDTFFVAQKQDLEYIDDIADETDAIYMLNKSLILPEIELSAEEYIDIHCDDGIKKQIDKNTDEAKKYIKYIEQELDKSKKDRIQVIGVNGHNENIYDTKDEIFSLHDYSSKYRVLAFGNYEDANELTDTGVNMVLTGGTYGVIDTLGFKDGSHTIGDYQLFASAGACSDLPNSIKELSPKRFMNFAEVQVITLHDGMVYKRNALERFIDMFMNDTGTIFDNDGGYEVYTHEYSNGILKDN